MSVSVASSLYTPKVDPGERDVCSHIINIWSGAVGSVSDLQALGLNISKGSCCFIEQ